GGRTFAEIDTPHGDHHDLWLHPDDPRRMINGNDGGANVSFNGGESWSTQSNQPTAQFYRVITDRRFPYYVYGGQQDNSTVAIASRTPGRGIGREDWYPVGGCESAHIAFDPVDPKKVYAGCYQGLISVYDVATRHQRNIMATPYLGLGSEPRQHQVRFNWNAPIIASPHDPKIIYHAGNVVLRSVDGGLSWTAISPDLTRDEEDKQGPGGGPITNEAAGGETYNTILYLVESPHEAGTLWAGTDDGLVHVSRDAGGSWHDATPEGIEGAQVNSIEISPHDPATVYLAVTAYKLGDFTPHLFKSTDYGISWQRLVDGIAEDAFVRVVREDPARAGLLYAGTETGLYVSFDGGEHWQPFQLELPVVPITDLTIRDHDLVAATQGRAFWILDNLTPLHQINDLVRESDVHLFKPRDAVRFPASSRKALPNTGENPPAGAIIDYYLSEAMIERLEKGFAETETEATEAGEDLAGADEAQAWDGEILLEILDEERDVVRRYSSREEEPDPVDPPPKATEFGFAEPSVLPKKAGHNRFVWDLRREQVASVPDLFVLYPRGKTYRVAPGTYQARLSVAGETRVKAFRVLADPRRPASAEAFAEQQALIAGIWQRVDFIHTTVDRLRRVRGQIQDLLARIEDRDGVDQLFIVGEALLKKIEAWEKPLVQARHKTFQDVINFPNRLNAQYLFLLDVVDASDPPVTAGALRRFEELEAEWLDHEGKMLEILDLDVPSFNRMVEELRVPAVIVPSTQNTG
ncbi:MAG: glycosyl hydrolase, partial [Thermoanaerobaculia bacterium]